MKCTHAENMLVKKRKWRYLDVCVCAVATLFFAIVIASLVQHSQHIFGMNGFVLLLLLLFFFCYCWATEICFSWLFFRCYRAKWVNVCVFRQDTQKWMKIWWTNKSKRIQIEYKIITDSEIDAKCWALWLKRLYLHSAEHIVELYHTHTQAYRLQKNEEMKRNANSKKSKINTHTHIHTHSHTSEPLIQCLFLSYESHVQRMLLIVCVYVKWNRLGRMWKSNRSFRQQPLWLSYWVHSLRHSKRFF